jgi:predicted transcriptional regulator
MLLGFSSDNLSSDLKELLIDEGNGILTFLLKNLDQLIEVLSRLQLADLNALLKDNRNGILTFLLKNPE